MPLAKSALVSGLQGTFSDPPATYAECAQEWADAVQSYASAVIPASTTVSAACAALSASLASAFQASNAIPLMEAAFLTFGASVGGGMAGFTPAPPAGPVNFASHFASTYDSHADAASGIADLIDTWMKTGTATPLPSGSPVNWS